MGWSEEIMGNRIEREPKLGFFFRKLLKIFIKFGLKMNAPELLNYFCQFVTTIYNK